MPPKNKGKDRLDDCEDIHESVSSVISLRDYLTSKEEAEIHRMFRSSGWMPNEQVLWSGMARENAQTWADGHQMQTLTTALGLLLPPNSSHVSGARESAPKFGWSRYIHGASAIFAWHIASGDKVTVLSPPPPQRFHPSGTSYFQTIELPILIAVIAKGACLCIEMVHPGVKVAENYRYQLWPHDEAARWIAEFHSISPFKYKWRPASQKMHVTPSELTLAQMTRERDGTMSAEKSASAAEPLESRERPRMLDTTIQENRMERLVECGPVCSRREAKKSKKKRNKKVPKTSSTLAKLEEGQDFDAPASAVCKGQVSLFNDAIAAMELQYQLDFPYTQRGRLPKVSHTTTELKQEEYSRPLIDDQAKKTESKMTPPEPRMLPSSKKGAESSAKKDSESRKTCGPAKKKAQKTQQAVKEKQTTTDKRAKKLAKQARKAAKRAANEERKAASKSDIEELRKQLRELQRLVYVILLVAACVIISNEYI